MPASRFHMSCFLLAERGGQVEGHHCLHHLGNRDTAFLPYFVTSEHGKMLALWILLEAAHETRCVHDYWPKAGASSDMIPFRSLSWIVECPG